MATIVAQATGNWSAGGTWTGGTPPGSGDTAQTGDFVVTIDQDITVATLEPTGSGRFECTAARTITANIVMSSTYNNGGLRLTHTTGTTTINGNGTGGSAANAHAVHATGDGGTTIINGNVTGGSGTGATGLRCAIGIVATVNGTATGGSALTAYGILNNSTGTVTCTTAIGGTVNTAYGIFGNHADGTTRAKSFQSSSTGVSPIGGFVYITEDAPNNTFKLRVSSGGDEVTLTHEDNATGGITRQIVRIHGA